MIKSIRNIGGKFTKPHDWFRAEPSPFPAGFRW